MTKIFIEAENKATPEYNFLKAFIDLHFPTKSVDFICIGGIDNLFNETNKNQISQAQEVGEQVIFLLMQIPSQRGLDLKSAKQR